MSEIDRLDNNIMGELPAHWTVRLEVSCSDSTMVRQRLVQVLRVACALSGTEDYHWWQCQLPLTFVDYVNGATLDDVKRNSNLWTLQSWVDAMKLRGWEWWSSELLPASLVVYVQANELPYGIGPLEFVMYYASFGVPPVVTELSH